MIELGRKIERPAPSKLSETTKGVSSPVFLEQWPEIALLVIERRKIKKPRQTPTITLYFDAGRVGGCLNDRATGKALFATADSVPDLILALNRKLMSDNPDWRDGRPWAKS